MASSPPPGYPISLPPSKKRPSMSAHSSTINSKRPKLHPLRQTSFPVSLDSKGLYGSAIHSARSETGSIANSALSATSATAKVPGRGRGRPRKSAAVQDDDLTHQSQSQNADTSSQANGRRGGTKSVVSAARSGGGGAGGDLDDDDEGDIDGMLGNLDEDARKEAEAEESRQEQRRDRLTDTFSPDHYGRYSQWRALTLNKTTIKKMVNGIVSQSVTQAPLQAVNIYAKWYVGEIVERAREVQIEFSEAYDKTREVEKNWREQEVERLELKQKDGTKMSEQEARLVVRDIARLKKEVDDYIPNPHRGGLLPEHLREALRRYKADGEGGGVGFEGLSHGLLGIRGSATWRIGDGATAKRLFR